jgi:hypothetical protein
MFSWAVLWAFQLSCIRAVFYPVFFFRKKGINVRFIKETLTYNSDNHKIARSSTPIPYPEYETLEKGFRVIQASSSYLQQNP